ncbi:MAG: peptide chain release factor N(5)-glutamine methyltransferase, partial [Desulfobacterales bacterium]|nr:peptide chain release factor N(5)-glutamine methyltransferase [Desulfobacterales bacterium]
MPRPEWTILSILEWTRGYFRKHDIENPRLDAEILLAHSLGLQRIDLYLRYDQPLDADELAAYRQVVKRRAAREPVAYILGRKEFWGLDLAVSPQVLTPRPDT